MKQNENITESFNDFFVNIGNMVEDKIPTGKTKFTDYLNKRNLHNIVLYPVDDIEIKSMISVLSLTACQKHVDQIVSQHTF